MIDDKVELSYSTLWKSIIRPPKDSYTEDHLGDNIFSFRDLTYIRKDYNLLNKEGYIIKASFIEPDDDSRLTDDMPVVIYLHGNSSSKLEGLRMAPELMKRNINIFVFDFAGCGMSEGDYISLGWHEKDDLRIIVDFVEKLPGVSRIGIWGRSMGAATAMMYNYSDERIFACCYDSPFCEFTRLATELCKKQVNLPSFLISGALAFLRSTIQKTHNFDIYKLEPQKFSQITKTPGFFLHAMNDELIGLDHSLKLFEDYGGEKSLNVCDGGHNSIRPRHIVDKVGKFFSKYLKDVEDEEV